MGSFCLSAVSYTHLISRKIALWAMKKKYWKIAKYLMSPKSISGIIMSLYLKINDLSYRKAYRNFLQSNSSQRWKKEYILLQFTKSLIMALFYRPCLLYTSREIGQHMILQCFAVGQETDDLILLRILELGHQRNALVAGTVDQDPLAFAMPLTAVFEPVIDDNHGNTHNHQFWKAQQHVKQQSDRCV